MFLLEETRSSKIQRGWSKGKIVFEYFVFVRPLGFWVAGNLLARLSALFGCMGREGHVQLLFFVFCGSAIQRRRQASRGKGTGSV